MRLSSLYICAREGTKHVKQETTKCCSIVVFIILTSPISSYIQCKYTCSTQSAPELARATALPNPGARTRAVPELGEPAFCEAGFLGSATIHCLCLSHLIRVLDSQVQTSGITIPVLVSVLFLCFFQVWTTRTYFAPLFLPVYKQKIKNANCDWVSGCIMGQRLSFVLTQWLRIKKLSRLREIHSGTRCRRTNTRTGERGAAEGKWRWICLVSWWRTVGYWIQENWVPYNS